MLALVAIAVGAVIYVASDKGFHVTGYAWLSVYFVFIIAEMVFLKHVVDTVEMSTWTRVYYNNALSVPMAIVSAIICKSRFMQLEWNAGAIAAVLVSCVLGVTISYAGFNLRKQVSATTFTVVGVVCKLLTVLINDLIWTQHSNALGHGGLLICIFAGFVYEKVKKKPGN